MAERTVHDAQLNLADEIMTLIGTHSRSVAVDALSQVVGLFCLTKSDDESRASLAEFVSATEQKRAVLEKLLANQGSR